MTQFGAGPDLAAQCPRVASPDGWRAWTDADGPVPDALTKYAQAFTGSSADLGATESYPLPGVTALLRVEPHVWGRDAQGALVEGCFRAAGIYLPDTAPPGAEATTPPASTDNTSKIVGVLTIASLAVGTAATLASWGKK